MKRILLSCLIGILMLISFANFVSSETLCDKDIDLILTLDNSASISDLQLNQIKTDSINFLNLLNQTSQRVGLASFARRGVLLNELTFDYIQVAGEIISMSTSTGGTNIGEVIDKDIIEFNANGRNVSEYIIVTSSDALKGCSLRSQFFASQKTRRP